VRHPFFNDERDYIVMWIVGFVVLVGLSVLFANAYVNAANDVSRLIP
jgi:hypothetical protein